MAAGSPATFLPSVLKEIQKASQDDRKMHLLLGSVKEVLSHSSPSALSELSQALWDPLFQICERAQMQEQQNAKKDASAKAGDEARLDGTRNIAAECLGKITLTDPAEYLGKLQVSRIVHVVGLTADARLCIGSTGLEVSRNTSSCHYCCQIHLLGCIFELRRPASSSHCAFPVSHVRRRPCKPSSSWLQDRD